MKNINLVKHFKKVENIKKKRLEFKKSKKRALELLKNKGYRDFIVKIKRKQRSDDENLESLELIYLTAVI